MAVFDARDFILGTATRYEIRPRSLGELLDGSFKLYRDHFKTFVLVAAVTIPPAVLLVYAQLAVLLRLRQAATGQVPRDLWMLLGLSLLAIPLVFLAAIIQQAALTIAIANAYLGESYSAKDCFRRTRQALGSLIAGAIHYSIGVAFGSLLCFIPGIIFFLNRIFYVPAIVVEGKSYLAAFDRSKELVRGQRQRLALMLLVLLTIQISLTMGLSAMVPISLEQIPILGALLNQIPQLLLAPIAPAFLVLAYFDARIRKEGFDLEMLSRDVLGSTPLPLGSS